MSQRKTIPCFSFLWLFSIGAFCSFAQTSGLTSAASPRYSFGPVTDYNVALPASGDVLRFRRGERYNIPKPASSELGENSEPTVLQLPETHFAHDPMPFDDSDVVVIATLTAGQAYLSNDRRDIYSEFAAVVQEVLKTPNAPYIRVRDSIDIQRKGGAIKLGSGKILVRGATANSMPLVGKRYLLFLKYDPNTQDYALSTGYQLEGAEVYRLDDEKYQESSHERVQHPLRRGGNGEDEFLARARTALRKKRE